VNAVDALTELRALASLETVQEDGCPALLASADQPFGDADCDGDFDAVDALQILRWLAGLQVNQAPGCTAIGQPLPPVLAYST
jgi:hypothetical protein